MVAVPEDASIDEAVAKIGESGHSRLPVYRERIDNVVGVIAALDILGRGAAGRRSRRSCGLPTTSPPPSGSSDLLPEMQRRRIQLAVVVDEYGAGHGIATVGDVVEEIVGESRTIASGRRPSSCACPTAATS